MMNRLAVPGIPGAYFQRVDRIRAPFTQGIPAGRHSVVRDGILLCTMPEIGTFLVREGERVEYREADGADPGWVTLVLHGTARGALIHQRGELPLHAATLVPPGGRAAVALCGESGAGKSTLATALHLRGWTLVADDTTRLAWDGSAIVAWPSRPSIKLWRDTCEAQGVDVTTLKRVTRDLDKYFFTVPVVAGPVPLAAIVELHSKPAPGPLGRKERLSLLTRNTFRASFINPLGMAAQHLQMTGATVSTCMVTRIQGKPERSVESLADAVEALVR